MAPQQNSTLIDENLDVSPSLINIPEEISRYSPILPPKNKINHDKNNNHNKNNNDNNNHQPDVNFVRNWEQTEREKRHYHKNKHHRSGSYRSGGHHSRRSRSISLYGVNSTIVSTYIHFCDIVHYMYIHTCRYIQTYDVTGKHADLL